MRGGGGLGKTRASTQQRQRSTQLHPPSSTKVSSPPINNYTNRSRFVGRSAISAEYSGEEQARDGYPASAEQLLITGRTFNSAEAHADR
ncbi:hypothetical protein PUN28_011486 [Cardiocondyla obscurior]|uniref:Uncharacterized protein n=1 Tax=Cardiocondyla obscurior TaxID=286306 RepID=A0AAW2FE06_9HYME